MEEVKKVADYFVIAGLPKDREKLQLLDEYSLEVNLKPSAYQDPITDITVIFPSLGENVPDYYQLIDATPMGFSANLNHGSFRSPEVFLCFRRDRNRPPLVDIGVLYDGKERVMPDSQIVEFTPQGHIANVNNATNANTYLTYRRANEKSACNELVVMDICVIVTSKGEVPPHSFMKIEKSLNRGITGSDVFICYKKSMNRADLIPYKPCLLSRFPLKDNPMYKLEETVALFCLPMGATLECWPVDSVQSVAVNSTFVLTLANRSKVYASAITFYEEVNEEKYGLSEEQKKGLELSKYRKAEDRKIYTNKCICILSRWPFFDAFEKFLFFLHKRQLMGPFDIPLEHFICHFLYNVPFPSPSRPRILLQLDTEERIAFSQPEELPLPRSGASFRQLLITLGPDNCLLVLLLALTEQKILLHSLRPAVLTSVAEAVMQIIFPFYWQCPYIPLCPIGMSDYLAAPLPFVIGLDSRFFDLYDQPSDVNAVDLDIGTVTLSEEKRGMTYKLLPKKASRYLRATLASLLDKCHEHTRFANKMLAHMDDGAIDFDFTMKKKEMLLELEIREAFLTFTVSILAGYKHFLLPITKEPTVGATDVNNLFDQNGFLRSRDKNFHKFYLMLMRTQMFTKFIEERSFVSDTNMSLAFFDECVDKLLVEEEPKFLELEGMDSDRTVFILPPDNFEDKTFQTENFELDPNMYLEPDDHEENEDHEFKRPIVQTPASNLARRTKQEIRSAQKMAKRNQHLVYPWTKYLINTTYSLWFIHMPGYILANPGKPHALRIGLTILQRMKRLRLHPADEICYRVMMQLCGVYDQPTLAVKVLFEMRAIGLHPNAVTYGYYNKAVLESTWPSSEAKLSHPQIMWNKIRLVLLGISIFKRVVREGNFLSSKYKSTSTAAMNSTGASLGKKDDFDGVSQVSQTSQTSSEDLAKEKSESASVPIIAEREVETIEEAASENISENISSQNVTNQDEEKSSSVTKNEDRDSCSMEKDEGIKIIHRLSSIVKPHESSDEQDQETEVALNESNLNESHDMLSTNQPKSPPSKLAKVSTILFEHQEDDLGISSLKDLKLDSLGKDKVMLKNQNSSKDLIEPQSAEESKASNNAKKVSRSLFQDDSQNSSETRSTKTKEEEENDNVDDNANGKKKQEGNNSSSLISPMIGTPIRDNDPLGALLTPDENEKPLGMTKSATLPGGDLQKSARKVDDNILGSPFSDEKLNKSGTMPSNTSTPVSAFSLSSLTKGVQMSNKLSKLKSSSQSITSYLSPNTATTKKTQEALNSMKSFYRSTATVVSKRVEEMRELGLQAPASPGGSSNVMSPVNSSSTSHQYLATPDRSRDEDTGSNHSVDSRRASADPGGQHYVNDQSSDTWSSFTGAIWDQFWGASGTDASKISNLPKRAPKPSDIFELFESMYAKMPRRLPGPEAMQIQMTSCSRCSRCHGILFDEEIMSGWTAEDSNLNTKCAFCHQMVVPFLTIRVADFRTKPLIREDDEILFQSSNAEDGGSNKENEDEENKENVSPPVPAATDLPKPKISDHITVPYISPLVLRKELENMLLSEGDACLMDPSCVDSHPIIFWNLIWYFERIAVKSHLPGLCLKAASLNNNVNHHPSWSEATHRNVYIKCRWDNERLHESSDPPLYSLWQQNQHTLSSGQTEILVITGNQMPGYRGIMQHIISGVQTNDLLQPIKTMLERRGYRKSLSSSSPTKDNKGKVCCKAPRSVYREILFLTLVSLGQDNIDLTAFDREYRRAFEALSTNFDDKIHPSDKAPHLQMVFCRSLFRGLRL